MAATRATIVSDTATQISVLSPPAQAAGTVDITVQTANGTSSTSAADQFTYVAAPTVSRLSPTASASIGGQVTIVGANLLGASAVDFGSASATIVSDTANQIVALVPNISGTVDVTVTTAGGTSATSGADKFTLAPLVPTVTINQAPASLSNQSTATFTFSGTGDFNTPANQLVYEVSLDGSAFAIASSPVTYSGLANGSHTFEVEAVDQANVPSQPAEFSWTVDTIAPTSSVSSLPARTALTSIPVSWSGSDAGGSNIQSYSIYVSVDGGPYSAWLSNTTQTSGTFTAQIGHTYAFYSSATDSAGNVEPAHATADATITTTLTPWQNPANPLDVNHSGSITPTDAIIIINYLNSVGAGGLPTSYPAGSNFYDVNGDGAVTPNDVIQIINYLDNQAAVASAHAASQVAAKSGGMATPATVTANTVTATTVTATTATPGAQTLTTATAAVTASPTATSVGVTPAVISSSVPAPAGATQKATELSGPQPAPARSAAYGASLASSAIADLDPSRAATAFLRGAGNRPLAVDAALAGEIDWREI